MRNLTIKARLRAAVILLTSLIVVVGVFGLLGMQKATQGLRVMYRDQLSATRLLSDMDIQIGRARAVVLRAMIVAPGQVEAELQKSRAYWAESDKAWETYKQLPMDATEASLSAKVQSKRQALHQLLNALSDKIVAHASDDYFNAAYAAGKGYTAMVTANDALKGYKATAGRETFEASEAHYRQLTILVTSLIALAVLASCFTAWSLSRAINTPLETVLTHFTAIARGDLTRPVSIVSRNEMGHLLTSLEAMREGLSATVGKVRRSSESIASASQEIAAGNIDLSARTEEQAASLSETTASMETLTASVKQNDENARLAIDLGKQTHRVALQGSEVVGQVTHTMAQIEDSSDKISTITGAIEAIAFQTNILALNAAVEAARAGEQGRGFAVVASEVRSLAQRSATAAKDIKDLIALSTERVKAGSLLAGEAAKTMADISGAVTRMSDVTTQMAAASIEQTRGIEQINLAMAQMDQVTQQNAALVEQAAAAATSLQDQAEYLRLSVGVFAVSG